MKRILIFAVTLCCLAGVVLCTHYGDKQPTIHRIQENGVLLVGTTGDYRPLLPASVSKNGLWRTPTEKNDVRVGKIGPFCTRKQTANSGKL